MKQVQSDAGGGDPPFVRTTLRDILAIPRWPGEPKTVEEISSLSNEALRSIFAEQEREQRTDMPAADEAGFE